MRMLERNKQLFKYRLMTGTVVPVLDPDGYETGTRRYTPESCRHLQTSHRQPARQTNAHLAQAWSMTA